MGAAAARRAISFDLLFGCVPTLTAAFFCRHWEGFRIQGFRFVNRLEITVVLQKSNRRSLLSDELLVGYLRLTCLLRVEERVGSVRVGRQRRSEFF